MRAPIRKWFDELQQLGERRRSRLVHGTAKGRLHRFQIGCAYWWRLEKTRSSSAVTSRATSVPIV
jgi:hypothetical protein